jgi:hypothetical protein
MSRKVKEILADIRRIESTPKETFLEEDIQLATLAILDQELKAKYKERSLTPSVAW